MDGIRYNHNGLYWEYFLRDPNFPENERWTHVGNIFTRTQDVDYAITNEAKAATWPIHSIRFARGQMVQLRLEDNTPWEVFGIRFPTPADEEHWWYRLRRRGLNNRVHYTESESGDLIPFVDVMLHGVEDVNVNDMKLTCKLFL